MLSMFVLNKDHTKKKKRASRIHNRFLQVDKNIPNSMAINCPDKSPKSSEAIQIGIRAD